MFIKPKPGRLNRHPVSNVPIPEHGGKVPDEYGRRRVAAGDAEETTAAKVRSAVAPAKPSDPKSSKGD